MIELLSDIGNGRQDEEDIIGEIAIHHTGPSCSEFLSNSIDSLSIALLTWEVVLAIECAEYIAFESEIIRLCESFDALLCLESGSSLEYSCIERKSLS